MIEWNAEDVFYYAAIVSGLFLIGLYFFIRWQEKGGKKR